MSSPVPPSLTGPLWDHAQAGLALTKQEIGRLRYFAEHDGGRAGLGELEETWTHLSAAQTAFTKAREAVAAELAEKLAAGLPEYPKEEPTT